MRNLFNEFEIFVNQIVLRKKLDVGVILAHSIVLFVGIGNLILALLIITMK